LLATLCSQVCWHQLICRKSDVSGLHHIACKHASMYSFLGLLCRWHICKLDKRLKPRVAAAPDIKGRRR
jgi:hypothetical protein